MSRLFTDHLLRPAPRSCPGRRVLVLFLLIVAAGRSPTTLADPGGRAAIFDDSAVGEIAVAMSSDDLARLLDPAHAEDKVYLPAQVHFTNPHLDVRFYGAGIRLRGNYARYAAKKSFKISLDAFEPGADLLGLTKINLNGQHNDPCVMREKLAIDVLLAAGVPVSRANHVRFFLNGEYRGLYIHVEEVDESFLRERMGTDGGNLYKCQHVSREAKADLVYRPEEDYEELGEPGEPVYELQTDRCASSFVDLAELIDVINNAPPSSFVADLERVLDVSSFLRALAFDVLAGSWDSYWGGSNNYYLYDDPIQGRFRYIPRDFDMTFGLNSINSIDYSQVHIYRFGHLDQRRPLVWRVLEIDHYRNLFTHFVEELLDGPLAPARASARVEELRARIRPAALADTYRTRDFSFIDYEAFDRAFDEALGGHVRHGFHPFLAARGASARSQIRYRSAAPALWDVAPEASVLGPGEPIRFAACAFDESGVGSLELALHLDSGQGFALHTMFDDGEHGDGEPLDGVFGVAIPGGAAGASLAAFVEAADPDGRRTRNPADAPAAVHRLQILRDGPVVLNELMALNRRTMPDEMGEYDDWIELWNRGSGAVNLASYRLTDDPLDEDGWELPAFVLAPGGHFLIWADGQPEQGARHASFRLDADGEWVGLFEVVESAGRVRVDHVCFGAQEPDAAFGRLADGVAEWGRVVPTPWAPNEPMAVLPDEHPEGPGPQASRPPSRLLGASPNPLTESTVIHFELAPASRMPLGEPASHVTLDVIDVSGRLRRRLVDGQVWPGRHAVIWNGRDAEGELLPAGVYVIRLGTAGETRTSRVALIR